LSYQPLHLAAGVVYIFFGLLGGFYALKTLIILYKSPEMLKTQRKIWLPILIGALFFTIGGILHLAEHSFYQSPEVDLLHEIVIIMGLSFFIASILQYSHLQINYYKLKREGLKRVQAE
jgi:heme/copper-type cytochrome/quinol oxidase subunit 3